MKKTLLIFFITLSALGQLLAFSGSARTDSVDVNSKLIADDADSGDGHTRNACAQCR